MHFEPPQLPDPVDVSRAVANEIPNRAGASPASDDPKGSVALDPEERSVLVAIAEGASRPEVARSLGISEEMIGRHVANVLDKLHRHGDRRSAAPLSTVGSEPEEDSERPTTFGS